MKKSRFSEDQVIRFIKQAEAGIPITAKFGGMDVPDAKRLRELAI